MLQVNWTAARSRRRSEATEEGVETDTGTFAKRLAEGFNSRFGLGDSLEELGEETCLRQVKHIYVKLSTAGEAIEVLPIRIVWSAS